MLDARTRAAIRSHTRVGFFDGPDEGSIVRDPDDPDVDLARNA
jgi:hypothetical protein